MKFPKTIVDAYGDSVDVEAGLDRVYLNDTYARASGSTLRVDFSYTPEQARSLAKALKKAAKAAEQ